MEFKSPTGAPTFFRTYSRRKDEGRESFAEVCERCVRGLADTGNFSEEEAQLVREMMEEMKVLPSGRWMWVGGTSWIEKPENFSSAFNCTTTTIDSLDAFGLMMGLGMMGCGTGATIEDKYIEKLPPVRNTLEVRTVGKPGQHSVRLEETTVEFFRLADHVLECEIVVGDSRQGWVQSMQSLLELAFQDLGETYKVYVTVDLSSVRPDGTPIKGFGGVANPIQLSKMYEKLATVLNRYVGRQLDAEGVCLLLDEVAVTIVAGNVRRYAGMRQFASWMRLLKSNLWKQDTEGNWKIDPERDALRMSNHTRVFHYKPSLEECTEAVRSQYYSGEGAIQWAGEAVARGNADILRTPEKREQFLFAYANGKGREWMMRNAPIGEGEPEIEHRLGRYELNPCGRSFAA